VAFEQVYRLVKELGQGRFSRVVEAQNRDSGLHYAVKIINKTELKPEEKELLRTEIAILRLVQHPHIIRLEDVFETSGTMYIVMELIRGGELFDNIVGRSRFTEDEARQLVKPLVDAVAYLHSLGIVHRDIKPENILCGDKVHDVSIADFGLSKLVHPNEVMTMPCGTLTYVAPEVLSMQGYHMEADMWSIGVIMYLVVRGRLPYDGDEQQAIVQRILHEPLDFSSGVWSRWSKVGVEFIKKLLEKTPARRLTARQALQHPWLRQPAQQQSQAHGTSAAAAQ
jgi:serine/threonine protein kinase